jgi:hypothetical protein
LVLAAKHGAEDDLFVDLLLAAVCRQTAVAMAARRIEALHEHYG